jgi:hypothetical protein
MSANEIRDRLANYLAKNVSVEDFEDWIAQNTWNIHQSGDEQAEKLAYSIESRLAEYSGSHIDENTLRRELSPMVTAYTPQVSESWASSSVMSFGSDNLRPQVDEIQVAVALPADTLSAKVLSSL